jgi:PAS domain S-box-containing protein
MKKNIEIDASEKNQVETDYTKNYELLLSSQAIAKVGSYEIIIKDYQNWDNNPTILSDEAFRIFGYEPGKVSSFSQYKEHLHPEDAHLIKDSFEELLVSGKAQDIDYRIVLKDGTIKTIYSRLSIITDHKEENVVKILGIIQDITERKLAEKKMAEIQNRLLESQKIAKIGSWESEMQADGSFKIIFLSDESYNIFGYEPNSFAPGEDIFYKHIHPEDKLMLQDLIKKTILNNSVYDVEHRIIDKNGAKKYLHQIAHIYPANDTGNLRLVGTCQDITERKNAEQILKKRESQLSIAMKIARLGYWELGVNEGVFTFNDQFYAMLKTNITNVGSYELSIEKYTQDFVYPDDQPMVELEVKKALTATDPNYTGQIEHRVIFGTGEIGWISVNFYIVKDSKGNTIKTFGVNQDITERKFAENKQKASQKLLYNSEEMGKIGSWEIYLNDTPEWKKGTTIWSDESYRILGYKPGSVEVNQNFFFEHVHKEDKHLISENQENLFTPGTQHTTDFRIILKNGEIKYLHGKLYIEFDEKDTPIKMVGMIQDVTSRKMLEIELERYNQNLKLEIEKQTLELNIANVNLNAFNYSISHDLKTPVRAMEMYVDLLEDKMITPHEHSEYTKQIRNAIGEMQEMMSTLLNFSKYSKGELNKENIPMTSKIHECIKTLVPENTGNIEFIILDTPDLYMDKVLFKNVFSNLLSNAIKYSSKKTHPVIEISGSKNEDFTTYYIKDNGDGFDEKLKTKLFKPFSRLHNEKEFEGHGAGLAIAERIISRHGGDIWAEGVKGKGAIFYFKVPNKKVRPAQ